MGNAEAVLFFAAVFVMLDLLLICRCWILFLQTVQKEWVSPLQRLERDKTRHYPEAELFRSDTVVTNPFLSAPYSDTLFKEKIHNM